MKVPAGVTVYGSGRQKFKAGQELPVHMKAVEKSLEKKSKKSGVSSYSDTAKESDKT